MSVTSAAHTQALTVDLAMEAADRHLLVAVVDVEGRSGAGWVRADPGRDRGRAVRVASDERDGGDAGATIEPRES